MYCFPKCFAIAPSVAYKLAQAAEKVDQTKVNLQNAQAKSCPFAVGQIKDLPVQTAITLGGEYPAIEQGNGTEIIKAIAKLRQRGKDEPMHDDEVKCGQLGQYASHQQDAKDDIENKDFRQDLLFLDWPKPFYLFDKTVNGRACIALFNGQEPRVDHAVQPIYFSKIEPDGNERQKQDGTGGYSKKN